MDPAFLGVVLDSSIIIEAERKHQTVEALLQSIQQRFGEIEITMSAVSLAELVHGIARADTQERRDRRRAFIDELKKNVPVHPVTDATAELAGTVGGEQAAKGNTIPIDDLLIGSSAIEQDMPSPHSISATSKRSPVWPSSNLKPPYLPSLVSWLESASPVTGTSLAREPREHRSGYSKTERRLPPTQASPRLSSLSLTGCIHLSDGDRC